MTLSIDLKDKETVGKISVDLAAKAPDTRSAIEQMRENLSEYDKNIWECIERSKAYTPHDFYIEVTTKLEPLLTNVLRNYFMFKNSCPTPNYDQAVYKYFRESDTVEFLWVIPDRETCHLLVEHRHEVPLEEHQLLDYVLRFAKGELFLFCKLLNGEIE